MYLTCLRKVYRLTVYKFIRAKKHQIEMVAFFLLQLFKRCLNYIDLFE